MSVTSNLKRAIAGAALASAMAGPIMITQAATASAMPISTLRSECYGAGGTWYVDYSYNSSGIRYVTGYECFYRDIDGDMYVDFYDRHGNYGGTG